MNPNTKPKHRTPTQKLSQQMTKHKTCFTTISCEIVILEELGRHCFVCSEGRLFVRFVCQLLSLVVGVCVNLCVMFCVGGLHLLCQLLCQLSCHLWHLFFCCCHFWCQLLCQLVCHCLCHFLCRIFW